MKSKHVVFIEASAGGASIDVLRQVRERLKHRVTFVTSELSSYLRGKPLSESPLRYAHRVLEVPSTSDIAALKPYLEDMRREFPIDACLTFYGLHTVAAAEAGEFLGLPHLDPLAARTCRQKHLARQRLAACGVAQPDFLRPESRREALAFLRCHGAVVAKPDDGSFSENVRLIRNEREYDALSGKVASVSSYGRSIAASGRLLLEAYIPGELISVETVTTGGRHHLLGLTDRILSRPPYFVELGGSFPVRPKGWRDCVAVVRRALDAVGFNFGPAHTEVILSPEGPKIVEINPRLAGGAVPEMMSAALGRPVLTDVVRLFLGERVGWASAGTSVATIRALHADRAGVVSRVTRSPLADDPRVMSYSLFKKPGDSIRPVHSNIDRPGNVTVIENDRERSVALADRIVAETVFEAR